MKSKHLTVEQRYQISALIQTKTKQKEIAQIVRTSESTISRELKRNTSKRGYSPELAQETANIRKERFSFNRKFDQNMQQYVRRKIELFQWSPEQIVGVAKKEAISIVSVERIYQFIRTDKKKGGSLYKHCRHKLKHRKRPVGGKKTIIPDKVSIDLRPDLVNNKERFGDWEIDTIVGPNNQGAIVTATERQTGFLLMKKLKLGKNAKNLAKELIFMMMPFKNFVESITSDNGTEFYHHKTISQKLNSDYFFAHPYASYQRGLNEYTNGLVRQYIPKKESLYSFSDKQILSFQNKINARPRKNLNFDSPASLFFKKIAFTS